MTTSTDRIAEASAVRPSPRQLAWQKLEFYGFIHFGVNTMTDREWGLGHEDSALFDPAALDADQWVESLSGAGMRAVILTCKHHDGFCLWPSAVTNHSVSSSPWKDGKGDVVADVAGACSRRGLKFGIYLSPWDRTEESYGFGTDYDDFFICQLRELLTNYGPLFSVWFDGACGEGKNGKKQYYDWDRYFALVRELQPDAVISVCGPDVRWCGNEAGETREDEWSVVPANLRDAERTASISQQVDDGTFSRRARSDAEDLGSRAAIMASDEPLVWYPSEVNTSIRPGWFYHAHEDEKVRSASELFDIYRSSVGGNATFLLNVPPGPDGLVAALDRQVLKELGHMIAALDQRDIAPHATVSAENGTYSSQGWQAPSAPASLELAWSDDVTIDTLILGEDISHGQQVDGLFIQALLASGEYVPLARYASIGYRRIVTLDPISCRAIRITITSQRGPAFLVPPRVLESF